MKARRYLALCVLAGGLAFGAGSAASWLLSRAASATGGNGPVAEAALPELVPVALDDEPAVARHGILPTLLDWLDIRFV